MQRGRLVGAHRRRQHRPPRRHRAIGIAPSAAASAAPSGPIGGTGTTEGAFYLYNWADYTDLDNIETFKKNYGITDWSYDTSLRTTR